MKSINLFFPFEVFFNIYVNSICIQMPVESKESVNFPGTWFTGGFELPGVYAGRSTQGPREEEQALLIPEPHSSSTVNTRILGTPCLPFPFLLSSASPFSLFSSIYISGTVLYCLALDDLELDFEDKDGLKVMVIFSFVILTAGLIDMQHKLAFPCVHEHVCACVYVSEDWTQGLMPPRQALYQWDKVGF